MYRWFFLFCGRFLILSVRPKNGLTDSFVFSQALDALERLSRLSRNSLLLGLVWKVYFSFHRRVVVQLLKSTVGKVCLGLEWLHRSSQATLVGKKLNRDWSYAQ